MARVDELDKTIAYQERAEHQQKQEARLKTKLVETRTANTYAATRIANISDPVERDIVSFNHWARKQLGINPGKWLCREGDPYFTEEKEVHFRDATFQEKREARGLPKDETRALSISSNAAGLFTVFTMPAKLTEWQRYYCNYIGVVDELNTPGGEPFRHTISDPSTLYAEIVAPGNSSGVAVEKDTIFRSVTSTPQKFYSVCAIDRELFQDSSYDITDVVSKSVGMAHGRGKSYAFTTGNGYNSSGTLTTGLVPAATTFGVKVGSALSTTFSNLDALWNLVGTIDWAYQENLALFMHQATWNAISQARDTAGRYYVNVGGYSADQSGKPLLTLRGHKVVIVNDMSQLTDSGHNCCIVACDPSLFIMRRVAGSMSMEINPYRVQNKDQIEVYARDRVDLVFVGQQYGVNSVPSIAYLST